MFVAAVQCGGSAASFLVRRRRATLAPIFTSHDVPRRDNKTGARPSPWPANSSPGRRCSAAPEPPFAGNRPAQRGGAPRSPGRGRYRGQQAAVSSAWIAHSPKLRLRLLAAASPCVS